MGKQIVITAGAPLVISDDTTVYVQGVHTDVKTGDKEHKERQAECTWVYKICFTKDRSKALLVSCEDMLPFVVPEWLLAQEKKMEKHF